MYNIAAWPEKRRMMAGQQDWSDSDSPLQVQHITANVWILLASQKLGKIYTVDAGELIDINWDSDYLQLLVTTHLPALIH